MFTSHQLLVNFFKNMPYSLFIATNPADHIYQVHLAIYRSIGIIPNIGFLTAYVIRNVIASTWNRTAIAAGQFLWLALGHPILWIDNRLLPPYACFPSWLDFAGCPGRRTQTENKIRHSCLCWHSGRIARHTTLFIGAETTHYIARSVMLPQIISLDCCRTSKSQSCRERCEFERRSRAKRKPVPWALVAVIVAATFSSSWYPLKKVYHKQSICLVINN